MLGENIINVTDFIGRRLQHHYDALRNLNLLENRCSAGRRRPVIYLMYMQRAQCSRQPCHVASLPFLNAPNTCTMQSLYADPQNGA